jgi:hypothetical protein
MVGCKMVVPTIMPNRYPRTAVVRIRVK